VRVARQAQVTHRPRARGVTLREATIAIVRDALLNDLRRRDTPRFLARLRELDVADRLLLEEDAPLLHELRAHLSGLALWFVRLTLRFGREGAYPVYARDLASAVAGRQTRRIRDLLRTFDEFRRPALVPGVREMLAHEFRGSPDGADLVRLASERELARRTRPLERFSEVHDEDGLRVFTGTAHFDVSRTASELRVIVRIRFVDRRHGATSDLPQAKDDEWRGGIERAWNGRFTATNGRTRLSVVFVPMFTGWDPHHEVVLRPGEGGSDEHTWHLADSGDTAAHEFGHMIGNPDEYSLPGRIAEIPAALGLTAAEELRSSFEGVRGEERPRRAEAYTLPGIMGDETGPAERRHAWPVLSWYNTQMRPAGEAPFRLE
jgi:hypothetical protein